MLDLARVGTDAGVDVELLADVRRAVPSVTLFAGGGVRGESDLELLASVGCDGALVATALIGLERSDGFKRWPASLKLEQPVLRDRTLTPDSDPNSR